MYFNSEGTNEVSYDAIVIGSGISGGWAAKELSEKGLKTLVLERGRMVRHGEYPTANMEDWELPNRNRMTPEQMKEYKIQERTGYTMSPAYQHWWPKDTENPYTETKPFDWIRAYHVGGRSLLWGRQSYRLGDLDFEANAKDGIAVDWPVRYKEIAPWYDYVESFIGVSGQNEGLKQLPDGKFLPPMEYNCVELDVKKKLKEKMGRDIIMGRTAHITSEGGHNGRGTCQTRNRCMRGCPFGAYFSSNASTLPAAEATGNMTIRPFSIVTEIILDESGKKAKGVRIVDAETKETKEYYAKIIFMCASTFGSTQILLNSTSERFPEGMGNESGELGHNVMDHHFRLGASGKSDEFKDKFYKGRRPTGIYIPRFRNIDAASKMPNFIRGYGYQGGGSREGWGRYIAEAEYGKGLKDALSKNGDWSFGITAFGECLPYHENKISLNKDLKDIYGLPTLIMDAEWKTNELEMRKDMMASAAEMLEAGGLKDVHTYDSGCNPGLGIHEMGTARMGKDPKTSVLNKWNQIHSVPNVFVTDGSFMTSAGCVNPSLTYMAFTARAANFAVEELKKGNL
ncbi:MAG: GMC family oxidoreductase [Saprospiraceae bacterium]|jgi:choline dehydrogenase-like flavoprotein|nr:GMC family oxidoreductase [Saprospiraceae bacterium]MBP6236328.1 GMC family oxidoreductase [Saprospiraceae bacterium]MBP6567052.1 GMC family oxidoreductase [Saprospiraceae bacterium]MBP9197430.1 GMC family oxidoreductase [Saprospiraceae bacterium]